jgi:glycosyltransferase involved in cell wall biosynthesis
MSLSLVTVLLPVYNAAAYLAETVAGVLTQTWRDFELLVIDDGSTDASAALLADYARMDSRVRVVAQPNAGLVAALNRGLALAQSRYIARLDADDVCAPERLARQVAFLEHHPRVAACGSWVHVLGAPAQAVWRYPVDDAAARAQLVFETPFCHPAVMLRRETLTQHSLAYSPEFREAEDYELWARLAEHGTLANLPEVLLEYRVHPGQKRQRHPGGVSDYANRVRQAQLARLGIAPAARELAVHQALGEGELAPDHEFLREAEAWLRRLKDANAARPALPEPAFTLALGERWFRACRRASANGWPAWRAFWRSPLSRAAHLSVERRLKFALRCALRLTTP